MTEETHIWVGMRGRYEYEVYRIGAPLKAQAGNYIFAKRTVSGWMADYIGQTEDLNDRLDSGHHKWLCIQRNGATHIHAHLNADKPRRLAEERDLIERHQPPCND